MSNQWTAEMVQEYARLLSGCVILRFGVRQEDGYDWPFFVVRGQDGVQFELTLSRDWEGNGPGVLFVEQPQ